MPQTKFQNVIYTIIMAIIMVYGTPMKIAICWIPF